MYLCIDKLVHDLLDVRIIYLTQEHFNISSRSLHQPLQSKTTDFTNVKQRQNRQTRRYKEHKHLSPHNYHRINSNRGLN